MTTVTTLATASLRPMRRARVLHRRSHVVPQFSLPQTLELALFILTSALPTLMLATAATSLFGR